MTPKGTHIQHPTEHSITEVGNHVTITRRQFIKSTTPLLTRSQVATILGITPIQVDRRTKAGILKRAEVGYKPGHVGYDMYENRLDKYVHLIDELEDPI